MSYDNRLQIHAGEDYNTIIVQVRDASNDIIELTDYTGYLHAKKYPPKLNAPLDISISSYGTDVSNGLLYFSLRHCFMMRADWRTSSTRTMKRS